MALGRRLYVLLNPVSVSLLQEIFTLLRTMKVNSAREQWN